MDSATSEFYSRRGQKLCRLREKLQCFERDIARRISCSFFHGKKLCDILHIIAEDIAKCRPIAKYKAGKILSINFIEIAASYVKHSCGSNQIYIMQWTL